MPSLQNGVKDEVGVTTNGCHVAIATSKWPATVPVDATNCTQRPAENEEEEEEEVYSPRA